MEEAPGTRLSSWKEIAEHLHRNVRTVRRWERERRMPVHRVPGGGSASVFAFTEEINRWLAGDLAAQAEQASEDRDVRVRRAGHSSPPAGGLPDREDHTPPALRRRLVAVLLVAGVVVSIGLLVLILTPVVVRQIAPHARPVQRITASSNAIRAIDDRGQTRWTWAERPLPLVPETDSASTFVGDPDPSGEQLVLIGVDAESAENALEASLFAFHGDGRLRWRVRLRDRFRFASGEYGPSWSCQSSRLASFVAGGKRLFAWSIHHRTWWPSVVLIIDSDGAIRGRFVNSGWITGLTPSPDGRQLLALGVSNSAEASVIAVLDPHDLSARSPEPAGSPYACLNCPPGRPALYVLLPRSAVSRASGYRLQAPAVSVVDNGVQVRVAEGPGDPTPETIYEFSSRFELLRASRSDGYHDARRRLEAAGAIPRSATKDEEDDAPGVRVWHPDRGWTIDRPAYPSATVVEPARRK